MTELGNEEPDDNEACGDQCGRIYWGVSKLAGGIHFTRYSETFNV